MLCQLSQGTEMDLSSMPDQSLSSHLDNVFESLKVHGMERGGRGWSWLPNQRTRDALALVKLVRALLSSAGVSLEGFARRRARLVDIDEKHQQENQSNISSVANEMDANVDVAHQKRVERLTSQLLSRFDTPSTAPSSPVSSTLATELQDIIRLLSDGESVQLDGLEDERLKALLVKLFNLVGLEIVELDDDNSDVDVTASEENMKKSYGYALPENHTKPTIISNLNVVSRVCRFKSSDGTKCAPVSWANQNAQQMESSSDEDDGPAPIGTVAAAKAAKRARHQATAAATSTNNHTDNGGREEWMMTPGQHDFLKGIQSKSLQSRTFKNERNRNQSATSSNNEKINPQVLAEVQAIQAAYADSRGPSLLDAHRQQKQQQLELQSSQKEWKWNREKNLDDGRRVDKNALHLVLGGAKTELAGKFQGSLG